MLIEVARLECSSHECRAARFALLAKRAIRREHPASHAIVRGNTSARLRQCPDSMRSELICHGVKVSGFEARSPY